jgi:serine/threonine protein kinase
MANDPNSLKLKVLKEKYTPIPSIVPQIFTDIITKCLQKRPNKRPLIDEIIAMEPFQ